MKCKLYWNGLFSQKCNRLHQVLKMLVLISIVHSFTGCASIPKYGKTDFVALKNIKDIEGEFENYPGNSDRYQYQAISGIINWKANKIDTSNVLSVTITVNEPSLEFHFHKANGEITSRKIRYQLKDNGFLYLKNRNVRLTGLPYILGYYDIKKIEVGLTTQRDLIINGIEQSDGALLFVLGSGSPKHNFQYIFRRK